MGGKDGAINVHSGEAREARVGDVVVTWQGWAIDVRSGEAKEARVSDAAVTCGKRARLTCQSDEPVALAPVGSGVHGARPSARTKSPVSGTTQHMAMMRGRK